VLQHTDPRAPGAAAVPVPLYREGLKRELPHRPVETDAATLKVNHQLETKQAGIVIIVLLAAHANGSLVHSSGIIQ
jgi:hypothetical protein